MTNSRTFTCVLCPSGCEIQAEFEGKQIASIEGALCRKGKAYVKQEIVDPRRNIASSVQVENGTLPLVSVRLTAPVPKGQIFAVMDEIRKIRVQAPVPLGQVIIENVLGLDCDVIATRHVGTNHAHSQCEKTID
jgi:CxxC motif-containing protein